MALERPPPDLPSVPEASLPPPEARRRFEAAGFTDPEAAEAAFGELLGLPPSSVFRDSLEETWRTLSRAADPDLALRTWWRWIEADRDESGGQGEPERGPRARFWAENPRSREGFLLMAGVSPALAAELERSWESFDPEGFENRWETPESLERRFRISLGPGSAAAGGSRSAEAAGSGAFAAALRRFRRTEDLRIAYLDECRRLPVESVTLQISWLADSLIAAALERAVEEVARRFQVEHPRSGGRIHGFSVLALGKLGSLELNYSSDVDLLFLRDEGGGPAGLARERREAYFQKIAERFIGLLADFTDEGQVYRIDTRLRPGGGSGPLVWPAQAALAYYHSDGRTWERQALIRLRPVAGDLGLARAFALELDPFIFRGALSSEELAELRGLKAQMERLAAERGESETHVKIGRGGIRDVEYIVQYLQLLHGAAIPELKDPNIFRVLEALEGRQLLNADETDSLRRGYRFLRQVEHRIQLNHLRQTHRLPEDPADLRRIARGLGHPGVESFRVKLGGHSARIRQVYRRLFAGAAAPGAEEERVAALLDLPLATIAAEGREYLEPFGFADPGEALRRLRLLSGEEREGWDQGKARAAFRRIAPRLLREISQFPDPDRTLANFQECVATLGAPSVFYRLLEESEKALLQVLEIAGRSTYAIEVLRSYPGLFDELIDALLTGQGLNRDDLIAEAEGIARTAADPRAALLEFKYLHFLLVAFRDLDRSLNLTSAMRHLSEVAEATLRAALWLARANRGLPRPSASDGRAVAGPAAKEPAAAEPAAKAAASGLELAVLALGKLGGEELNYRSDLDLVFLYRAPAGADPALSQEAAHRLAAEVLEILSSRDQLGPLWKVDVRLRPMDSKNLLALSFDEFQRYFREGPARLWERQAFLRARPVAGDTDLAREAVEFLARSMPLGPEEDLGRLKGEVAEMRRRLESAAGRGDFIKRGWGGVVDVEFLAQTLQLLHGRAHPEVLDPNTPEALKRLTQAGLLGSSASADLLTSYQFLRWLETRLSLLLAPEEGLGGLSPDRLRSLIHRLGYRSTGEVAAEEIFEEELHYHRKKNRAHLEELLGRRIS